MSYFKQENSVSVSGRITRDVELRIVQTRNGERSNAKFGIAYGDQKFANLSAWGEIADYAGTLRKGDRVRAEGTMQAPREYNGKTYQDIECDFLMRQPLASSMDSDAGYIPPAQPQMQETNDDMPF